MVVANISRTHKVICHGDLVMKKVAGAIIIKDKSVLILRRSPDETFPGFWEFPGGKIEKGETPENCLARELKEELKIESIVKEFFHESIYEYAQGYIQLLTYIVEITKGCIQLTVHDKYEWANKENLLNFELLPADIPVAKKIMEVLI